MLDFLADLWAFMRERKKFWLAPIIFGPVMNITASTLANWWRNHPADTLAESGEAKPKAPF